MHLFIQNLYLFLHSLQSYIITRLIHSSTYIQSLVYSINLSTYIVIILSLSIALFFTYLYHYFVENNVCDQLQYDSKKICLHVFIENSWRIHDVSLDSKYIIIYKQHYSNQVQALLPIEFLNIFNMDNIVKDMKPRFTSDICEECKAKFHWYWRHKLYCTSCGYNFCFKHIINKIELPQHFIFTPQLVCSKCMKETFELLQEKGISTKTSNAIFTANERKLDSSFLVNQWNMFHLPDSTPPMRNIFGVKTSEQEFWFAFSSPKVLNEWILHINKLQNIKPSVPKRRKLVRIRTPSNIIHEKKDESSVLDNKIPRDRAQSTPLTVQETKDLKKPALPSFQFAPGDHCAMFDEDSEQFFPGRIIKKVYEGSHPMDKYEVEVKSNTIIVPAEKLFKSKREKIKWEKKKLIGKGAHGKIYEGINLNTGTAIAIKQLDFGMDVNKLKLFDSEEPDWAPEISLMQSLSHPNLVRLLGCEIKPQMHRLYILMELVNGGSISNVLKQNGPFPESLLRNYSEQILNGLNYLHDNRIVHRDLNCSNILLSSDGICKIADLGISKKLMDALSIEAGVMANSNLKTMVGTPQFLAPEVVTEEGYGRKADIWSLGCTIIQMSTGNLPWKGLTPIAALYAIGEGTEIPNIPQHLSTNAKDFISNCLVRDKNRRSTTSELLEHPWILTSA